MSTSTTSALHVHVAAGRSTLGDFRRVIGLSRRFDGVVYTTSSKKQAEHGGFANDDTNVMMLVCG